MAKAGQDTRDSCADWLADAVHNLGLLTPRDAFATDFVEDLPSHVHDVAANLVVQCEDKDCKGNLLIAKMIIDRACEKIRR